MMLTIGPDVDGFTTLAVLFFALWQWRAVREGALAMARWAMGANA